MMFRRQSSTQGKDLPVYRSFYEISLRSRPFKISEASVFVRRLRFQSYPPPQLFSLFSQRLLTRHASPIAFKRNITGAGKTNENAGDTIANIDVYPFNSQPRERGRSFPEDQKNVESKTCQDYVYLPQGQFSVTPTRNNPTCYDVENIIITLWRNEKKLTIECFLFKSKYFCFCQHSFPFPSHRFSRTVLWSFSLSR